MAEADLAIGCGRSFLRGVLVCLTPSALSADWDRGPFYLYNGADQLVLYGKRYIGLAVAAFSFGIVCVAVNFFAATRERDSWTPFELPLELYAVTFCATALL